MGNTKKTASELPGSFSRGKQGIWSLRTFSTLACAGVIGYVTFYGTNMLGIPAGTVGLIIMISKLFDAVTDITAGVLVDRTRTKWGKGRPYELSVIGLWISTVLMYACPDLGMTGKCIWLFVWYTVLNDVFFTLLNAAEPVYMMRAIPNRQDMEKTASLNGIASIIGTLIVAFIYPLLMATLGSTKTGWTIMAAIFAVPLTIVGILRFLFIPEVKMVETEKTGKLTLSEIKAGLTSNKYIYLYILLIIVVNLFTGMNNQGTYYFTYIVKNQALMSLASLPSMITPFLLLFFPMLLKKYSVVGVSKVCAVIGIIGNIIKHFAGANMALIVAGGFAATIGLLPLSAFAVILLTDTVDYNEFKTGVRIEGLYSSMGSFGQKIGLAFASVLTGFLLDMSGFISSNTASQPDSAIEMIRVTFGILPAIVMALILVVLIFFDLEKKMPEVREKLAARRQSKQ